METVVDAHQETQQVPELPEVLQEHILVVVEVPVEPVVQQRQVQEPQVPMVRQRGQDLEAVVEVLGQLQHNLVPQVVQVEP